jgi:DNA/RNA-binding domain of Phe-tRNA-synthetase-like protein
MQAQENALSQKQMNATDGLSIDTASRRPPSRAMTSGVVLKVAGVKLGVVEADNVQAADTDTALASQLLTVCDELRRLRSLDSLRKWEPVEAVRKMFGSWGMDPSKYRPSSEALMRRVLKGNVLPRILNIVDVGNWGALETGWPYGCYDLEKIAGYVEIRHGKPGEQYEGIGRQILRLEARPIFADNVSPFGSPISDSTRTMITHSTSSVLVIICAPASSGDAALRASLSRMGERLVTWCGAMDFRCRIVRPVSKLYSGVSEPRSFECPVAGQS